ncbi:MAG TPA: TetR/AcrR family transcriptional regulator [Sporichthya sp.]|nr:TetR/AcrR family transcriptional regulator [Sporichthya sp.]
MTVSTARPRGRPKKVTLEEIADAALALLDSEGMEAVSFRRVAAELGVSHMTLYSYLDSKEALLDAVVGRALEVPELTNPHGDWPASLREVLIEIHDALVARPGVAQLILTQALNGPWVTGIRDRLLALLKPAGFSRARTVDAISVLVNYVLGTAMVAASRGTGASPKAFAMGLDLLIDGLRAAGPAR